MWKQTKDFIEVFARENDLFDLQLDALLLSGFTEEITKLNMLEAFYTLKSSVAGRTEFMNIMQSLEDSDAVLN